MLESAEPPIQVNWTVASWFITIISAYSMYDIYHWSKSLKNLGIFANLAFMSLYVATFLISAIINTVSLILADEKRDLSASWILLVLQSLTFFIL